MNKKSEVAGGHDAPIESPADDLLDSQGVARAMHRFLKTTPPSWSTRIGLFGRWGSGKTSILNLLRTLEEADGALVVSFSAWSATGEAGVIAKFYETLAERLRQEQIRLPVAQRAKRFLAKALKFSWIGRMGRKAAEEWVPLPPAAIKTATAALDKLGQAASGWTKVGAADLSAIVALLQRRRVVVFIDDLDRADPALVPKTLLALRELLDWPGFAFVLAFDKRAIASALAAYSVAFGDDADGFLEKVIDIPFEVPEPSGEHREQLARAAFGICCDLLPDSTVVSVAPYLPAQPRRVKIVARMMGSLRPSLARHSISEVDWLGTTLYLILKEASPAVAEWVVTAASDEDGDWLSWMGDEEERKKKQDAVRTALINLMSAPKPPDDAERIVRAASMLLGHWQLASKERIAYWVALVFREPSITTAELQALRTAFAFGQSAALVDKAIDVAAGNANLSGKDAAMDVVKTAINCYSASLDSMASARTMLDLARHRSAAEQSLLLLEHLYTQDTNRALMEATAHSEAVVPLVGLVAQWLGWTRNEGEAGLRGRERELALRATARCIDPDSVYASTDPFWNRNHAQDAEALQRWRDDVRQAVAPAVVAGLCARFLRADGMVPVASGDDRLGPWLVENPASPLYTEPALCAELVSTLEGTAGMSDEARSTLAKNATLFLRQMLFQTRSASWGDQERAKVILERCPDLLPAGWMAVVAVPTPFRGHSGLRKLKADLVALGVPEQSLPEPDWLLATAPAPTPVDEPEDLPGVATGADSATA